MRRGPGARTGEDMGPRLELRDLTALLRGLGMVGISEDVAEVVWRLVYQKWRDALNVAAAEPSRTDAGREAKKLTTERGQKDDD
jgi:hypothetical protein